MYMRNCFQCVAELEGKNSQGPRSDGEQDIKVLRVWADTEAPGEPVRINSGPEFQHAQIKGEACGHPLGEA